jgi:hypothetical protein
MRVAAVDFRARPIARDGDPLEMVSGLVAAQHSAPWRR